MPGIAAARRGYNRAVDAASRLWGQALAGDVPDAATASAVVAGLASLMAQDPTALVAVAVSSGRDRSVPETTFTHMVNVAALTMAQAVALRIDGPLIHDFGVAALMHDIGKVLTPPEVLHKPDALTPEETVVIQRHVIDGASILRRTPGMTPLAPVVAFEHHLGEDLSGYPANIGNRTLNVCTSMVSIADVFDALRSDRPYRQGLATSRVRAIMDEPDALRFNQPLLSRFIGLVGLFPVGSLVRLRSGELAVVTAEHADNPGRPRVKVIADPRGDLLEPPISGRAWGPDSRDAAHAHTVAEVVDPASVGIDPLAYL